jgi:deoxycytidylate deaminase
MDEIKYPYIPSGRMFRFVDVSHPMMAVAKQARQECAGDSLYPVGATLARDGHVLARAGNGYNRGAGTVHVCPRVVLECPSGIGYDLCHLHDAPGHAEPMLIAAAKEQGIDTASADVYLYGHWWCCEPCWNMMNEHGIRDVYLLQNAHIEFARDRVYAQTLQSHAKQAYIAGAYTNNGDLEQEKPLHQLLGRACEELGCRAIIPFRDNPENDKSQPERDVVKVYQWTEDRLRECDVLIAEVSHPSLGAGGELALAKMMGKPIVLISKKGSLISNFARGNPAVVYHIEYETPEQACRMFKNVLKQL